jgi:quercetin dioxygenase-like cupin family protein
MRPRSLRRLVPSLLVALIIVADHSVAQEKVEMRGVASGLKLEEIVSGHVLELNDKFKMRATEVTIEPGGFLGPHHHAGPGIRFVVSGQLTFVQAGKAHTYAAGDYFYEAGNIAHTAQNKTKSPLRMIFFEILPVQWSGPSVIPPKAY